MTTNPPGTESEDLDDLDRDPFEELASEFVRRFRSGERPAIEEYASAHPDLAEEIRDLFPTIAAMEQTKPQPTPSSQALVKPGDETVPLEQLGDYRLMGEIGRGGMGIVYEAEQISLARRVAVKVLPRQALLDERHLKRFEREAQTAAKLHHTNIVPVFGVGQQEGYHYIVMQLISGVGLDEVLLALRRIALGADEQAFDLRSSSHSSLRFSHANQNAKALLDGDFSELPHANSSSSLIRSDASTVVSPTQEVLGEKLGADAPTLLNVSSTQHASRLTQQTLELSAADALPADASSDSAQATQAQETHRPEDPQRLANLGAEFYRSVARIGEQVADALAYAHEQGTLHRDIKPGNLLLDATGTVWVADFGLAKWDENDNVSRTGDIVGTLSYIPPESFSGTTDARGDIYSLGLSLFELLALRPAFFGRDRSQLVRDITEGNLPRLGKLNPFVPRDLETIVLKAVSHRPEDRYATAAELAHDLNCFLNDRPIRARRMSLPEQFTRWYRKNKLVAGLSAAVATLLIATSILFGVLGLQARQSAALLADEVIQKDLAKQEADRERDAAQKERRKAERERQTAQKERSKAERERQIAQTERQKARDFAYDAVQALTSMFPPVRLPVSSGASLTETSAASTAAFSSADNLAAANNLNSDTDAETEDEEDSESAVVLAAPPIDQETTARLELLLGSIESLAAKAENYSDFAVTFADLTLQIGMLHKALGNLDRALEAFDRSIAGYDALTGKSNATEYVIGLAVGYNEKAELLGTLGNDRRESYKFFQKARETLEGLLDQQRETNPAEVSPRAQYELARTLFLMSIQRQQNGDGERRGRRPDWMRGGFRAESNLRKAIQLLEPLGANETNPEYRYLLARCYSAMGSVARPDEREQFVDLANDALEELVQASPGEDDYKYEFAVAKLRKGAAVANLDRRLKLAEQAVALLDQICARNPDVLHYQIARARALDKYVVALDQYAVQMQIFSAGDDNLRMMSQIAQSEASEEATRAASLFQTLENRFHDAFSDRLPDSCAVAMAEVISKTNPELAVEYFRNAAESSEGFDLKARAELGLARALLAELVFDEAYEILVPLTAKLEARCDRFMDSFFPDSNRFLDSFELWAEAVMVLEGDLETADESIQQMVRQRMEASNSPAKQGPWKLPPEFLERFQPVHRAEIDFRWSRACLRLEEMESATKLASSAEATLESLLNSDSSDRPTVMQKSAVGRILKERYQRLGYEEKFKQTQVVTDEVRELLSGFFRRGRGRRPPDGRPGEGRPGEPPRERPGGPPGEPR